MINSKFFEIFISVVCLYITGCGTPTPPPPPPVVYGPPSNQCVQLAQEEYARRIGQLPPLEPWEITGKAAVSNQCIVNITNVVRLWEQPTEIFVATP